MHEPEDQQSLASLGSQATLQLAFTATPAYPDNVLHLETPGLPGHTESKIPVSMEIDIPPVSRVKVDALS